MAGRLIKNYGFLNVKESILVSSHENAVKMAKSKRSSSYKSTVDEFLDSTTLHGMGYIGMADEKPWYYDWFFFIAIGTGVFCAVTLVLIQIQDYRGDKVQTTFDGSLASIRHVHFPSITVCNINRVRKSFLREFGLNGSLPLIGKFYWGSNKALTEEEVEKMKRIATNEEIIAYGKQMQAFSLRGTGSNAGKEFKSTLHDESLLNLFLLAAVQHPGEKTILYAKYNGTLRSRDDWAQLHPYVLTDYGYCSHLDPSMLFHPSYSNLSYSELSNKKVAPNYWDTDRRSAAEEAHREFSGVRVGKHQGLELLVDVEGYDYGFAPEPGEGARVGITNFGDEAPITLKGHDFSAGGVHHIRINPVLTSTSPVAMNRFSPEVRGCYFQHEFKLSDYSARGLRYSLDNCLTEAMKQAVDRDCGCDFFREKAGFGLSCYGENFTCFRDHHDSYFNYNTLNSTNGQNRDMHCLPACNDQRNDLLVTNTRYPHLHLRAPVFCTIAYKMRASCKLPFKAGLLRETYGDNICELVSDDEMVNAACHDEASHYFLDLTAINETLKEAVVTYTNDNVLALSFYFADTSVTRIVKDEKLSIIWYIAAIGGILGLCMGVSVITMFELCWYAAQMCGVCGKRTSFRFKKAAKPHYLSH